MGERERERAFRAGPEKKAPLLPLFFLMIQRVVVDIIFSFFFSFFPFHSLFRSLKNEPARGQGAPSLAAAAAAA